MSSTDEMPFEDSSAKEELKGCSCSFFEELSDKLLELLSVRMLSFGLTESLEQWIILVVTDIRTIALMSFFFEYWIIHAPI